MLNKFTSTFLTLQLLATKDGLLLPAKSPLSSLTPSLTSTSPALNSQSPTFSLPTPSFCLMVLNFVSCLYFLFVYEFIPTLLLQALLKVFGFFLKANYTLNSSFLFSYQQPAYLV